MDAFILLKLLCCVVLLTKACDANSCSSTKCSFNSPEIRFPFGIQSLQPHQCGLPEYNLFCRENRTMIRFPSYGDLVVKSISYDAKRLNLVDPKNCVHEVFLNLNLSLTPFSYCYVVQHYKYINCSTKLVASFEQVPCLSGSNHHVYIVQPSFSLPVSCTSLKTVAIPFSYSPYLSDSSFGLGLTWNSIRINQKQHPERYLRTLYAVTGIIAVVFIVGKLLYASLTKYRMEFNGEKVKKKLGEEEIDKLLGEYEALNAAKL